MSRFRARAGIVFSLVALLVAVGITAWGEATLYVIDSGTLKDDQADIFFGGTFLGRSEPAGTTFLLGNLLPGTVLLEILHQIDDEPPGTYTWILSGGGLFAYDDAAQVQPAQQKTIDVLANDLRSDVGTGATPDLAVGQTYTVPIQVSSVTGGITITAITSAPLKGAAQISPGGGSVIYTAASDKCGTDTFSYRISGGGLEDTATVTVTIPDLLPRANPDARKATVDEPLLIDVLDNDGVAGDAPLTIIAASNPTYGSVTIVGDQIRYVSSVAVDGSDRFTYTVAALCGATATADVSVRVNGVPSANAGGPYRGFTGDVVEFDARFSIDANFQDTLQYRWDLNSDGKWNTDWLSQPTYEVAYDRPFRGQVTLEVRDVYLGIPNGTSNVATAFILIEPKPSQIAVSVYVDLNGNGEFDDEDVGLPGVSLLLDAGLEVFTEEDGTAIIGDVKPGAHTISISGDGVTYLQERGFFLSEEALANVEIESGEWVALFFSPEAQGFLEVDLGAEADDAE